MMETARVFWERAITALHSANLLIPPDPDGAASRAYYAAFNAVSALLALEGKSLKKRSAVDSAVHRDLVRTGRWPSNWAKNFHPWWNRERREITGTTNTFRMNWPKNILTIRPADTGSGAQEKPRGFPGGFPVTLFPAHCPTIFNHEHLSNKPNQPLTNVSFDFPPVFPL
ncbi:MAG: hypothetical protein HY579_14255 [Nitrospinae bacterium]|nr:hypothetical protein [Nitrospinota bacterium]